MTKTFSKKFLCFVVALVMVLSSGTFSAFAVDTNSAIDEEITLYFSTIGIATSGISISGVKASCKATVSAKTSTTLKIKMEIQKKKSSGYETVETWTSSRTGSTLSLSETRTINVLSTYRLKTTFTAGSETHTQYTYPS